VGAMSAPEIKPQQKKSLLWRIVKWALVVPLGVVAFCAAVYFLYSYFAPPKRLYLVSYDRSMRIEVPYDIVKAQDCKRYKEWIGDNFSPLVLRADRCPWRQPIKGPIGEFVLNGVKLYIPRAYLLFDKNQPDGEVDGSMLLLLMQYPDMGVVLNDAKNDDSHVQVTIHSSKEIREEKNCRNIDKEFCNDPVLREYFFENSFSVRKYNKQPYIFEKIKEWPALKLTEYKINVYDTVFIRGDVKKPTYWIKCAGTFPCCETFVIYNEALHFSVSFRQETLFEHQEEIIQKVMEKIKEFTINPIEVRS
jgi:hypothetical protein